MHLINNRELIRISNCSRFRTAGPMLAQTWSCTQKKPWTRNGCCIRTWPWCNETNGKEEKTSKPVPKNWNKLTTNTKRDTRIGRPIKSVDVNSNRSLQLLPFDSQIVLQSLTYDEFVLHSKIHIELENTLCFVVYWIYYQGMVLYKQTMHVQLRKTINFLLTNLFYIEIVSFISTPQIFMLIMLINCFTSFNHYH